jgi:hypothetical protein
VESGRREHSIVSVTRQIDVFEPTATKSDGACASEPALCDGEQIGTGVECLNAQAPIEEHLGQLAGPTPDLENLRRWAQCSAFDRAIDEPRRVRWAGGLIRPGDAIERQTQSSPRLIATHGGSVVL